MSAFSFQFSLLFTIILIYSHICHLQSVASDDPQSGNEEVGKRFVFETREQKQKWEDELVADLTAFFDRRSEKRKKEIGDNRFNATSEDDDNFVKKYGTDRMTSGRWELISKYPHGSKTLVEIAQDAHRIAGLDPVNVSLVVKESRWLDFYDPNKYPFIKIDVLVYADEDYVKADTEIPYFFYLTKGLEADCVYYLKKESLEAMRLTLGRHVCGIPLPTS